MVELEHHTVLTPAVGGLKRSGAGGEVGAHGGAAHIDIVQVVGNDFTACTVAIIVVERIVARHHYPVIVVVA